MSDLPLPIRSPLRPPLTTGYDIELRVFRTAFARGLAVLAGLGILILPFHLGDYWLSVANFAAIAAIAVVGLNLVAGDAGQVSLGHAFFVGVGAYIAGWLGTDHGWPFPLAVLAAAVVAAASSLVVGPLALRLRGLYLAFATVAFVFIGQHLFVNITAITGGAAGRPVDSPSLGGVPMAQPSAWFGRTLNGEQKWFFVSLLVLAVVALALRNLQRSRLGRAFHSVRDQDIAAATIGIHVARVKTQAFVISAFVGGLAGALLGGYSRFINPQAFGLQLSVQYLAMAIVGGLGSVSGGILGAVFITAIPRLIDEWGASLPFVETDLAAQSGFSPELLSSLIYGIVVIVFLVAEPDGIAGLRRRLVTYLRTWPFRR